MTQAAEKEIGGQACKLQFDWFMSVTCAVIPHVRRFLEGVSDDRSR
jgi:hypothetical protein